MIRMIIMGENYVVDRSISEHYAVNRSIMLGLRHYNDVSVMTSLV